MNSGRQKRRMERIVLLLLASALVMWNLSPGFNKILAVSTTSTPTACVVDQTKFDDELNVQAHPTFFSWTSHYQTINANEVYERGTAYYTLYGKSGNVIIPKGKVEVLGSSGYLQLSGNTEKDGVTLSPSTNYKIEITLQTRYRGVPSCTKSEAYEVQTNKDGPSLNEHQIELSEFETEETMDGGYHKRSSMIDGFMIGNGNFNHIGDDGEFNDLISFDLSIYDLDNEAYSLDMMGDINDDGGPWKHMHISPDENDPNYFTFWLDKFSALHYLAAPEIMKEIQSQDVPDDVESAESNDTGEKLDGVENDEDDTKDVTSYSDVNRETNESWLLRPNTRYTSTINFRNDLENVETGNSYYDFMTKPDVTEWLLTPGHIDTALPDSSNATGGNTYGCFYPYEMNDAGDCQSASESNDLPARVGADITGMSVSLYSDVSLHEDFLIDIRELEYIDGDELSPGQYNNKGFEYDFDGLDPDTTYYVKFIVSNDGGDTEINAGEFTTLSLVEVVYVDINGEKIKGFDPKYSSYAAIVGENLLFPVESVPGYRPKYFSINDLDNREFIKDGEVDAYIEDVSTTIYVECLSTMISVAVPKEVNFQASPYDPIENNIKSDVSYCFRNNSELPVKVTFGKMNVVDADGIDFVSSFNDGVDQLKLRFVSEKFSTNGFEYDIPHKSDENLLGIEPDYDYSVNPDSLFDNRVLEGALGILDGKNESIRKLGESDEAFRTGVFRIGGGYNGRFYKKGSNPKVDLTFHLELIEDYGGEK